MKGLLDFLTPFARLEPCEAMDTYSLRKLPQDRNVLYVASIRASNHWLGHASRGCHTSLPVFSVCVTRRLFHLQTAVRTWPASGRSILPGGYLCAGWASDSLAQTTRLSM